MTMADSDLDILKHIVAFREHAGNVIVCLVSHSALPAETLLCRTTKGISLAIVDKCPTLLCENYCVVGASLGVKLVNKVDCWMAVVV